jgi:predicted nucleic acid-binding protein
MTHLFDTSAILAHHLAESGADRVQALFEDETNHVGICVVSFLEFEVRLREMGLSESERQGEILRYKALFDEVILVDEAVCSNAAELKFSATPRLPNIDALIAASAALHRATLVHRDPHFLGIPPTLLTQEVLPQK